MKLLILIVFMCLNACNEPGKEGIRINNEHAEPITSIPFSELYLNAKPGRPETKAINEIKGYLLNEGWSIDSLYVYKINYSVSCDISDETSFTTDPLNACIAIFNIEHKVNRDYYLRIEIENDKIYEDYEMKKRGKSEPLFVPGRPVYLRNEILLYYYFKGDSIVDVLSH
ncbi:hypothetical protein [Algoriphagus antarcticus]|nr:hypothetical protein [Algoriphagus antarcticus]